MNQNVDLFNSLQKALNCEDTEGLKETYCPHINLFYSCRYEKQQPIIYEPGLFITLSGKKVAYINDYSLAYGPEKYLIVATPYPMSCQSIASTDEPLFGFYIKLQQEVIFKYIELLKLNGQQVTEDNENFPVGFDLIDRTERLELCVSRVLTALHSKLETEALMDGILEELYFLLLQTEQGQVMVNFAIKDGTYYKVAKAVNHINDNFDKKLNVDTLAEIAGMSTSAFHRAFKNCITESPLQYLKKIRLNRAKSYLVKDSRSISEAALLVGYESVPQFSREFKRYFGLPPSQADELGYRLFV